MRTLLAFLSLALLLAACSQSPPSQSPTLADIAWSNTGPTSELLTLRPDRTYKITDPRANSNARPQFGTYDVIAPAYGIILLDAHTPIRLSIDTPQNAAPIYRFTPFTFTPTAAIPPDQRDQFIHLVDQYYAPKPFLELQSHPPVAPLLPQ